MKKTMKKILALLLAAIMVLSLAACGPATPATTDPAGDNTDPAGDNTEVTDVTLKVWGPSEDQANENSFLQTACKKFAALHPEWNITFKYGVCSEGDAGKNVTLKATDKNTTGYQVMVSKNKNFKTFVKKVKYTTNGKALNKTVVTKKFFVKGTNYVKVRAYTTENGVTVKGNWSPVKTVKF